MMRLLATLLLPLLMVSPAWSWSAPDHQAIAEAAQGHLNDRAKVALAAILFDTWGARERGNVAGRYPPAKVRATQRTLGGGTYLDREATPAYVDIFLSGKKCGAACKGNSATWEF